MTDIGGIKTVYAPVAPSVDNNAKPSTGGSPNAVGPGSLVPAPNVTWVEKVGKTDATRTAWQTAHVSEEARAAGRSGIEIGASEARTRGLSLALQNLKLNNPTTVTEQEPSVGGTLSGSTAVEDAQKATKQSLDNEAKHDQEVASAKNEAFLKLLDADKKMEQLDGTQGTAAPAA